MGIRGNCLLLQDLNVLWCVGEMTDIALTLSFVGANLKEAANLPELRLRA